MTRLGCRSHLKLGQCGATPKEKAAICAYACFAFVQACASKRVVFGFEEAAATQAAGSDVPPLATTTDSSRVLRLAMRQHLWLWRGRGPAERPSPRRRSAAASDVPSESQSSAVASTAIHPMSRQPAPAVSFD